MTPSNTTTPFNIFVVGHWNPAIFSPAWAKENLGDNAESQVDLAISGGVFSSTPPRLTVDGINIYPSTQHLSIDPGNIYNDNAIERCVLKFQKISDILSHTPVGGVGVNFRFIGNLTESTVITEMFNFADAGNIDDEVYDLSSTQIMRTFNIEESSRLNLSITSKAENLKIDFNFHTNINKLSEVTTKIPLTKVNEWKDNVVSILQDFYNLQIEA